MRTSIYESIWRSIKEKVDELEAKAPSGFVFNNLCEQALFDEYEMLIDSLQENNLLPHVQTPDRHKIAAAFIIAIMRTNVITVTPAWRIADHRIKWLFNEHLAITIGLSILSAYMVHEVKEKIEKLEQAVPPEQDSLRYKYLKLLDESLQEKMILPVKLTSEDTYIDCFKKQLYFDHKKSKLSVLNVSQTLFSIERNHKHVVLTDFLFSHLKEKDEQFNSIKSLDEISDSVLKYEPDKDEDKK